MYLDSAKEETYHVYMENIDFTLSLCSEDK